MVNLLQTLIISSEKAAQVARSCVSDTSNDLLVAEKDNNEANTRFDTDYKTIADVLAQETIKENITSTFPELARNVRGEECPEIKGEIIAIKAFDDTVEILSRIIPLSTAKVMVAAAFSKPVDVCKDLPEDLPDFDLTDIGIWIDPIDATAEFIAGVRGEAKPGKGLICATVLVGAYLISTGEPIMGVINQPFANDGKGSILWGVSYKDYNKTGGTYNVNFHSETKTLVISSSEKSEIIEKFKKAEWEVKMVSGTGNKMLKVALGEASALLLSKPTTYLWDTCAGHAILKAKGGETLTFHDGTPLTYNTPESASIQENANSKGFIAFANYDIYKELNGVLTN